MKCDLAQQHIIYYVYGELADEACHELELHVSSCGRCRTELQVYQALHQAMSLAPLEEPSANLVAQCRVSLEDALDQLPPPNLGMRLLTSVNGFVAQLRAAPALAAGLAAIGFLLGGLAGHAWRHLPPPPAIVASSALTTAPATQQVLNVSGIVQHPDTNMVEVHYNQIVPETMEGTMDDPEVQKLLLLATHNAMDPSVQDDSVNLLAAQCRAGHFCDGGPVRTALIVALRYDRDASVRAKALDGLQPYVAQDVHVRDAILESLLHDPSPQVRSAAIQMLQPVQADSSVRVVLQTLAQRDSNPMVRTVSEQVLRSMPVTQ
jgi:hypothetical protein